MGNLENVYIGCQKIKYGGIDLGHTDGGCEFTYTPEYTDILVDAYGTTVADKVLTGEAVTVKVPLAEFTLERLKSAIPSGTLAGDVLKIGSSPGKRLSTQAQELVLHPMDKPDEDKSLDIKLHKAVIVNEIILPFRADEKTVYEVEFLALVDESNEDGNYLASIGE
ncbi:hypothetical protein [Alkaliphilus peptidifermentans]|uniref:Uncharacterized protein n=1 Tax=Alkaliphilus peptidifermentans DSM 18978 TaxID=1120976 RepID=A0A1G5JL78_9FIRM|nr:hypothetical protein [Alkaliphilus peptidifermentans]SCY88468.1 hypothetical protein SAMN03080606_02875 [Alkaliphilus peptidifermentans DSM 18978]